MNSDTKIGTNISEVGIGRKIFDTRDRYYWIVNETERNIYRVPKLFDQLSVCQVEEYSRKLVLNDEDRLSSTSEATFKTSCHGLHR